MKILIVCQLLLSLLGFQEPNNQQVPTISNFEETITPVSVEADYAVVYNVENEVTLYDKEADATIYPASMTKIMTAIVAMDKIEDMQATITMSEQAWDGLVEANASVANFPVGAQVTYKDLLAGLLLPSGADAANQLAISLYGSQAAMVDAMNAKAKELHLQVTHFENTTGLHDPAHVSTAHEIAQILAHACTIPELKTMMSTKHYQVDSLHLDLYSTVGEMENELHVTNSLIDGGKTGYTPEAGVCLASFHDSEDGMMIAVVAHVDENHRPAIVQASQQLYQYVDDTYSRVTLFEKGKVFKKVDVRYSFTKRVGLMVDESVSVLVANHQEPEIDYKIEQRYDAPIKLGETMGMLRVQVAGQEALHVPIVAANATKFSVFAFILYYVQSYWYLVVLLLAIVVGSIVYIMKQKKHNV